MSNSNGLYGQSYDRYVERYDDSALSKMQLHYWQTKQTFLRKLKGKEDDCIIASDAELDAKLELLRSIDESCQNLISVLEAYQDRICGLAHEESAAGRFLKECAKLDKTRAGKMMSASGKTLCYTAQQRIQLRNPLVRLYQEVETFQYRAVADTMLTIDKMESARTAYRAALLWMKDISQQLDPDTYKQLEKFRKVQSHVRKTKARFDRLKIDCIQKVDLLSASRCNMYSNALVGYQNTSLLFWEKTAKTMNAVSDTFKGYQYYEFTTLKELTETSRKLAEETSQDADIRKIFDDNDDEDKDRLIFFDADYRDDDTRKPANKENKKSKSSGKKLLSNSQNKSKKSGSADAKANNSLLDLNFDQNSDKCVKKDSKSIEEQQNADILTLSDGKLDDMSLLSEILNAPTTPVIGANVSAGAKHSPTSFDAFMPSQLIDLNPLNFTTNPMNASIPQLNAPINPMNTKMDGQKDNKKPNLKANKDKAKPGDSIASWLNLFADLDPLANPDAIGKKADQIDDRNC
ncbi:islet cell autoantigen 1-like [Oppia nitens]|uniref:islet cell autoantigen 1-like n=1 Tax=Oppia nitens TaxID=1686743 RepID=UPI0023DB57AF|nr:islet cell autoantigen 1-like [Oppia nitens]